MKDRRKFLQSAGLGMAGITLAGALPAQPKKQPPVQEASGEIWYIQPAANWMQALPIGNGRLGAMVFGDTATDRIALNEITLWAGKPDPNQEIACGKEKLAEIRRFFFEGNLEEGNNQAIKFLSGKPNSFGTHLPLGNLLLDTGHPYGQVSNYRRALNLEDAIASISYEYNETRFSREYICSNPDQVLMIRLAADKSAQLNTRITLDSLSPVQFSVAHNRLLFQGKAASTLKVKGFPHFSDGGVEFAGGIHVQLKDGSMQMVNNSLQISSASEIIIYIDLQTNYKQANPLSLVETNLNKASRKKLNSLVNAHTKDYQRLYNSARFRLDTSSTDFQLPTDERLYALRENKPDNSLYPLFFQYNRYLLIACSRENSPLPANLQGLWNDNLAANMPWTCDYHLDINTQQNYWASNVTNLADCQTPLFDFIRYLQTFGRKTAQKVYGAKGWVAHTVCNVWGYTAPGEWPGWGLFPTAGTWIALHLWEHFQFTQDMGFLRNIAYPLLKDNAEFFLDYLVEDPRTGYLMTGPTTSPENSFRFRGHSLSLSMMPTCDRVFVFELFQSVMQAASLLNQDPELVRVLENALKKLPPFKIGKNGGLQEWLEDYEEAIPNHRHTTHLVALYPYAQIDTYQDPELAAACRVTMEKRMSAPNWEDVEWSRGNMINFYARLKDGEAALNSIWLMLKQFTSEALLTYSVAGIAGAENNIFILDGNQSACSGIAEMLIQSHNGYIEYLPALPESWHSGEFDGLCVRGAGLVSAKWRNGQLIHAGLTASVNQIFRFRWFIQQPDGIRINGRALTKSQVVEGLKELSMKAGDKAEFYFKSKK